MGEAKPSHTFTMRTSQREMLNTVPSNTTNATYKHTQTQKTFKEGIIHAAAGSSAQSHKQVFLAGSLMLFKNTLKFQCIMMNIFFNS